MALPGAGAVFLMLLDSGPDVVGLQGPDQLADVGLLGLLMCISRILLSLRLLDCESNLLLMLPDSRAIIRLWLLDLWTCCCLCRPSTSLALLHSKFLGRSIFDQLLTLVLLNYRFLWRNLYLFQQPLLWLKSLKSGVPS